jgi:hypothetical protein
MKKALNNSILPSSLRGFVRRGNPKKAIVAGAWIATPLACNDGFLFILGNASARAVHHAEVVLGGRPPAGA